MSDIKKRLLSLIDKKVAKKVNKISALSDIEQVHDAALSFFKRMDEMTMLVDKSGQYDHDMMISSYEMLLKTIQNIDKGSIVKIDWENDGSMSRVRLITIIWSELYVKNNNLPSNTYNISLMDLMLI